MLVGIIQDFDYDLRYFCQKKMKLNTYLSFNGDCKEAMSFYRDCLSGTFDSVKYFADGPEEIEGHKITEELKDNVMHMTWRFGDDNIVMASDSIGQDPSAGKIKLSLTMDDPGQMNQIFEKMSLCGQIIMPLADTFWGARFGMLTDKYGKKRDPPVKVTSRISEGFNVWQSHKIKIVDPRNQ